MSLAGNFHLLGSGVLEEKTIILMVLWRPRPPAVKCLSNELTSPSNLQRQQHGLNKKDR
jgi:hypothetical protein